MSRVKNTMGLIEKSFKTVNSKYDIHPENIEDICKSSKDMIDVAFKGFLFGYMQGMKASKAGNK